MIDLHLHTTASDGRLTPAALVALAARTGLDVISVTDHDTVAGLEEASQAAGDSGIELVTGIEITAVEEGRDVHILGYFFEPSNIELQSLLTAQRAARIQRLREMAARLASLGYPIDVDAIVAASSVDRRSIGRPALADALVSAGCAVNRRDAFDRLLGADRPAFVARCGPSLAVVCDVIRRAGGVASLAHPVLLGLDDRLPRFAEQGLSALEVRHSEHPPSVEQHYRGRARALGLAMSGGSDFHGDGRTPAAEHGAVLGQVTLDLEDFDALRARAGS